MFRYLAERDRLIIHHCDSLFGEESVGSADESKYDETETEPQSTPTNKNQKQLTTKANTKRKPLDPATKMLTKRLKLQ